MKKEYIHKFLYSVSLFLVVGFAVRLGVDWFRYDPVLESASFKWRALVRAVEFLLPAVIVFIAARILKKKYAQ